MKRDSEGYEAKQLMVEAKLRLTAFMDGFENEHVMQAFGMMIVSHEFIGLEDVLADLEEYCQRENLS